MVGVVHRQRRQEVELLVCDSRVFTSCNCRTCPTEHCSPMAGWPTSFKGHFAHGLMDSLRATQLTHRFTGWPTSAQTLSYLTLAREWQHPRSRSPTYSG